MKRKLIATAAAAAMFMVPAWAHGPGMAGGGMTMGPGMMGGYGAQSMGPGMMGGSGAQGMGPGMMGPGMMGGSGAQGMGPGMMGPGMMGDSMMGASPSVNLTEEQRTKISTIQREVAREQWTLMGKMHEQQYHMHDLFESGNPDNAAASKAYDAMSAIHKQMFQNMLGGRKRVDAVLTDEQRQQLRRGG